MCTLNLMRKGPTDDFLASSWPPSLAHWVVVSGARWRRSLPCRIVAPRHDDGPCSIADRGGYAPVQRSRSAIGAVAAQAAWQRRAEGGARRLGSANKAA